MRNRFLIYLYWYVGLFLSLFITFQGVSLFFDLFSWFFTGKFKFSFLPIRYIVGILINSILIGSILGFFTKVKR